MVGQTISHYKVLEKIVVGFGSSDCKNGCGSHLKFVGSSTTLDRQFGKGET